MNFALLRRRSSRVGNASHNPLCFSVQCGQHIRVKVGDPVLSFLGDAKVAQDALDVWAHNVPVEFCVAVPQVAGRLVPELLVEACLLKFN